METLPQEILLIILYYIPIDDFINLFCSSKPIYSMLKSLFMSKQNLPNSKLMKYQFWFKTRQLKLGKIKLTEKVIECDLKGVDRIRTSLFDDKIMLAGENVCYELKEDKLIRCANNNNTKSYQTLNLITEQRTNSELSITPSFFCPKTVPPVDIIYENIRLVQNRQYFTKDTIVILKSYEREFRINAIEQLSYDPNSEIFVYLKTKHRVYRLAKNHYFIILKLYINFNFFPILFYFVCDNDKLTQIRVTEFITRDLQHAKALTKFPICVGYTTGGKPLSFEDNFSLVIFCKDSIQKWTRQPDATEKDFLFYGKFELEPSFETKLQVMHIDTNSSFPTIQILQYSKQKNATIWHCSNYGLRKYECQSLPFNSFLYTTYYGQVVMETFSKGKHTALILSDVSPSLNKWACFKDGLVKTSTTEANEIKSMTIYTFQ